MMNLFADGFQGETDKLLAVACKGPSIYQNYSYKLYADKVTQEEYTATVESLEKIVSDFG